MKLLSFAFAMTAWISSPAAMAADIATLLDVKLDASKVVTEANGVERHIPADTARPGDIIEYRVSYQNRSTAIARKVQATLPIPVGGLEFLPNAAQPRMVRASLDGKRFDPIPLQRKIRLTNGKQERQPVPTSEYRFLRWDLGDISAGRSVTVSARMRVVSSSERQGVLQ